MIVGCVVYKFEVGEVMFLCNGIDLLLSFLWFDVEEIIGMSFC